MLQNDIITKKYERLFDLVRRMRGHQKEYFKYRSSEALNKAKHFERQVDQLIKEELQVIKSKQQDLF